MKYNYQNGVSSHTIINILPEVYGLPYSPTVETLVYGVASSIRITGGEVKCDARTNRATVFVDKNSVVQRIELEVEIPLPTSVEDGHEVSCNLSDEREAAGLPRFYGE